MTRLPTEGGIDFGRIDRFARWAGTIVLAIASVALLGWILDSRILQSFYPGWVTMKANTAIGLALGGAALLLHTANSRSKLQSRLAQACGAVIALIGAATTAQYAFAVDLGIDQLVFSSATATPPSDTPGRMALLTAIALVLIGSSLALTCSRPGRAAQPAQLLAVLAGGLCLAALLGHVYGTIPMMGSGHGIQIALFTAVAIVLLAAGVLAIEARNGWIPTIFSPRAGGQLARRLLPLAFGVPLVLGALQSFGGWTGIPNLDGAGVVAVLTMFAFAIVIWRTARELNETDAEWQAAEQDRMTLAARAEASSVREAAERRAREVAEHAAREKDEALTLLNLVLDSTPVGFALFDRDLRLQRANRAFAEMTDAKVDDHAGHIAEVVVPHDPDAIVSEIKRVFKTGRPVVNTERTGGRAGSGDVHHWLSSKYPVRSRDGDTVGVGMTLMEITEQRTLEAQLQQSQKMEAVGQLAGGVAHDFNNILAAIRSFAELVASDLQPDSELQADVREIVTAADRGSALTRQLLAFSRQQRLDPTVVSLSSVAEGVTKLLARLMGTDVAIETSLPPSAGSVLADSSQIGQVIVNLAVNARDAMPNGGTLRIETANVTLSDSDAERMAGAGARGGDYVMLAVSDTGHGIDAETQRNIFEPFFTTKEASKGTGLGLSTVYGIITQSGGYLAVSSKVGRGTTFSAYLPRVEAEPSPASAEPAAGPAATASATVLLVDDDDAVRTVLARVLGRAGLNVLPASSGEEAQRVGAEYHGAIDLLMTDLLMPDMNGGELAQRIRAARPGIRVLYTSGYTDDAVFDGGLIRHDDPFLSKPFTIDGVLAKVREALAADDGEGSAAA